MHLYRAPARACKNAGDGGSGITRIRMMNDHRRQEFIEAVAACLVHLAQQAVDSEPVWKESPAPLAQLYALPLAPVAAGKRGGNDQAKGQARRY